MLRFRARDQHRRRNFKFKPPEFLLAGEVLRWFAGSTTRDQSEIAIDGRRFKHVFRMGINPSAVAPQDMHEKQFSRERMRRNFRGAKSRHRLSQCRARVHSWCRRDHDSSSSSLSRSDSKCVTSESTSEPIFPSMPSVS